MSSQIMLVFMRNGLAAQIQVSVPSNVTPLTLSIARHSRKGADPLQNLPSRRPPTSSRDMIGFANRPLPGNLCPSRMLLSNSCCLMLVPPLLTRWLNTVQNCGGSLSLDGANTCMNHRPNHRPRSCSSGRTDATLRDQSGTCEHDPRHL